jgi:PKD repeat protein
MARPKIFTALALAAVWMGGCTMKSQDKPSLTGPSELSTSISISVSPDTLSQDGGSQSLVTITARDANGQPLRNLSMRVDIAVGGVLTDFGTLSARNVVSDANGRATVTYTAPPAPAGPADITIVEIVVTPNGSNFGNELARQATVRLVPPGIIIPPPTGLTPKFTFTPTAPIDHQVVLFDASTSTSANGTIVSYQWDFGDGGRASGVTATHSFSDAGTFIVTLTVTDTIGRTNSVSQSVTVGAGAKPTAAFIFSPTSPLVSQQVNFNASTSVPATGRRIVSYDWNFGDGSPGGSGVTTSHTYTVPGTFTVVLTVTDDAGHTGVATQSITVGSGLPTASFTAPATGSVGVPMSVDASASTAVPGRTIVSYSWNFGDGGTGSGVTASHTYLAAGTYTIRLTVTDSAGATAISTKTITIS